MSRPGDPEPSPPCGPDTPLGSAPEDWWLMVRCGCRIVSYHAAHRACLPVGVTAAEFARRGRCEKCGERPREVAWEAWLDGHNRVDKRRVPVAGEPWRPAEVRGAGKAGTGASERSAKR